MLQWGEPETTAKPQPQPYTPLPPPQDPEPFLHHRDTQLLTAAGAPLPQGPQAAHNPPPKDAHPHLRPPLCRPPARWIIFKLTAECAPLMVSSTDSTLSRHRRQHRPTAMGTHGPVSQPLCP